jgi:hypothetical protein
MNYPDDLSSPEKGSVSNMQTTSPSCSSSIVNLTNYSKLALTSVYG